MKSANRNTNLPRPNKLDILIKTHSHTDTRTPNRQSSENFTLHYFKLFFKLCL